MLELLGARRLEGVHLAALRIDAGHHVLDDAVLAGGVHALEHHQHAPLAAGVEALLQIRDPGNAVGENRLDVLDVGREAEALGRIMIGDPEVFRVIDPASLEDGGELHRGLTDMGDLLCAICTPGIAATSASETQ